MDDVVGKAHQFFEFDQLGYAVGQRLERAAVDDQHFNMDGLVERRERRERQARVAVDFEPHQLRVLEKDDGELLEAAAAQLQHAQLGQLGKPLGPNVEARVRQRQLLQVR